MILAILCILTVAVFLGYVVLEAERAGIPLMELFDLHEEGWLEALLYEVPS